ncbi:Aldo/keto reductase [Atractiella rhizophila]|nr:Aldo/keto reductase [Atractiella rhizophila]
MTELQPRRLSEVNDLVHSKDAPLELSPLILGAATFGSSYNDIEFLKTSTVPEETVTTAFRYGMNAVDTSVYYSTSEELLGRVFSNADFRKEFPRSSYYIITKAGRYGATRNEFDYSRERIFSSVKQSCKRMNTEFLDVVYLHDVEFVGEDVGGANSLHFPLEALKEGNLATYGLDEASASRIHGLGDERVLDGVRALFELKEQGIVNRVGIAGYPLATLLRLSILIANTIRPLDILQSYSHHTLQNHTLSSYIPHFKSLARIPQIVNASPLSMGLLRSSPPQAWHPAPAPLRETVQKAAEMVSRRGTSLEAVALGFGFTSAAKDGEMIPTVIGLSGREEAEKTIQAVRDFYGTDLACFRTRRRWRDPCAQQGVEREVCELLRERNWLNWSWASPPEDA